VETTLSLWLSRSFLQRFFLQQRLGIPMHAVQLLGDRVHRAVLLLGQPLDPPDLMKAFYE